MATASNNQHHNVDAARQPIDQAGSSVGNSTMDMLVAMHDALRSKSCQAKSVINKTSNEETPYSSHVDPPPTYNSDMLEKATEDSICSVNQTGTAKEDLSGAGTRTYANNNSVSAYENNSTHHRKVSLSPQTADPNAGKNIIIQSKVGNIANKNALGNVRQGGIPFGVSTINSTATCTHDVCTHDISSFLVASAGDARANGFYTNVAEHDIMKRLENRVDLGCPVYIKEGGDLIDSYPACFVLRRLHGSWNISIESHYFDVPSRLLYYSYKTNYGDVPDDEWIAMRNGPAPTVTPQISEETRTRTDITTECISHTNDTDQCVQPMSEVLVKAHDDAETELINHQNNNAMKSDELAFEQRTVTEPTEKGRCNTKTLDDENVVVIVGAGKHTANGPYTRMTDRISGGAAVYEKRGTCEGDKAGYLIFRTADGYWRIGGNPSTSIDRTQILYRSSKVDHDEMPRSWDVMKYGLKPAPTSVFSNSSETKAQYVHIESIIVGDSGRSHVHGIYKLRPNKTYGGSPVYCKDKVIWEGNQCFTFSIVKRSGCWYIGCGQAKRFPSKLLFRTSFNCTKGNVAVPPSISSKWTSCSRMYHNIWPPSFKLVNAAGMIVNDGSAIASRLLADEAGGNVVVRGCGIPEASGKYARSRKQCDGAPIFRKSGYWNGEKVKFVIFRSCFPGGVYWTIARGGIGGANFASLYYVQCPLFGEYRDDHPPACVWKVNDGVHPGPYVYTSGR